ncbi:MAG: hypothetical protein QOE63_1130, partial [Acidimicrobiaceae bacterium]
DGGWFLVDPSDSAHRKDTYNTTISWTVPLTFTNGDYSIFLKAYDTDNNKPGNDCGVTTWAITVSGGTGNGAINLVE